MNQPATTPELHVFDARSGLSARRAIADVWEFRDVLWAFTVRNVRVKYKQALLGFGWVLLQPLAFLVLFTVFFGRVVDVDTGGVPYAAFALSALVPWQFVSNGLTFGGNALLADSGLLRKVYFPRDVPVLGAVGATLPDLAVSLGLFVVIGPFIGAELSPHLLWAPLLALLLVVPVLAVSLPIAALNVYYRDFRHALPLAVQLLLFASPVAYPMTAIPEAWRMVYAFANPVAGILDGFHRCLALGVAPDARFVAASALSGLVLLLAGHRVFRMLEPDLADVI